MVAEICNEKINVTKGQNIYYYLYFLQIFKREKKFIESHGTHIINQLITKFLLEIKNHLTIAFLNELC